MTTSTCSRGLAALLGAAFLWALALSVSPLWHECIHADASRFDHTCAVTAVASGGFDHSNAPLLAAPHPVCDCELVRAVASARVGPVFLSAAIFEHAPPVFS